MPEYFFHIRLDIAGQTKGGSDDRRWAARKTGIFATPPQLHGTKTTIAASGADQLNNSDSFRSSSLTRDWRAGLITIQSIDMTPSASGETDSSRGGSGGFGSTSAAASAPAASVSAHTSLNKRIASTPGNASTKARFEPSDIHETEVGWGVVKLFRDAHETPELSGDGYYSSRASRVHTPAVEPPVSHTPFKEEDCTTLCILAVPSYFSPTRFLSWVGDQTREEVSHFRMIRTEESSRYMVLMRFQNGKKARDWRKEWNGVSFDDASPEIAQVVFVKSIELMPDEDPKAGASFPDMEDDPFSGSSSMSRRLSPKPTALGSRPPAPPTPSLIEMPTCPVCLERMDESSGLLTILCQHVFHCSCLYKWRGTGCPVCRFSHSGLSGRGPSVGADEDNATGPNECSICHSEANLWICLVCGNIGCGRYDAAHAYMHWQQSGHSFSMDMTNQRIWDYESDAYVHRIVQNKLDGKITEEPDAGGSSSHDAAASGGGIGSGDDFASDYVPREKSDAIGREYTALLTSQLESQRAYFEDKVSQAADKAAQASRSAVEATQAASKALAELSRLRESHALLAEQTVPALERERDRAVRRADKAQDMARAFERDWRDEKSLAEGLHARIEKLDLDIRRLTSENADAKKENADQADLLRDLQFFISGQQKLKDLGDETAEANVSLPPTANDNKTAGAGAGGGGAKKGRKGKGKGKSKEDAS